MNMYVTQKLQELEKFVALQILVCLIRLVLGHIVNYLLIQHHHQHHLHQHHLHQHHLHHHQHHHLQHQHRQHHRLHHHHHHHLAAVKIVMDAVGKIITLAIMIGQKVHVMYMIQWGIHGVEILHHRLHHQHHQHQHHQHQVHLHLHLVHHLVHHLAAVKIVMDAVGIIITLAILIGQKVHVMYMIQWGIHGVEIKNKFPN